MDLLLKKKIFAPLTFQLSKKAPANISRVNV